MIKERKHSSTYFHETCNVFTFRSYISFPERRACMVAFSIWSVKIQSRWSCKQTPIWADGEHETQQSCVCIFFLECTATAYSSHFCFWFVLIFRRARWERAQKLQLDPPAEVLRLLEQADAEERCLWDRNSPSPSIWRNHEYDPFFVCDENGLWHRSQRYWRAAAALTQVKKNSDSCRLDY